MTPDDVTEAVARALPFTLGSEGLSVCGHRPNCLCEKNVEGSRRLAGYLLAALDVNRIKAEALREAAEAVNLHANIPDAWHDDERLAGLCEDDECLFWDMTYHLRESLNNRATALEQGAGE